MKMSYVFLSFHYYYAKQAVKRKAYFRKIYAHFRKDLKLAFTFMNFDCKLVLINK